MKLSKRFSIFATLALGTALGFITGCSPNASERAPIATQDSSERAFQKTNIKSRELTGKRQVALTFDDGPSRVTPQLLDLLKREGVKATFFVLGRSVKGREAILQRAQAEGHVIANHSYSHDRMSDDRFSRDPELAAREIWTTHLKIKPFLQPKGRLYFRAPFGAWLSEHAARLNDYPELRAYIGPVYWTAGGDISYDHDGRIRTAADWACWSAKHDLSPELCAEGYLREIHAREGGVVLMHDLDSRSIELAGIVITALKEEGYAFLTLDQMHSFEQFR